MTKYPVLFLAMTLLFLMAAKAEDKKQKFDSQPYTDDPTFKSTFPEAPGMSFDVPRDTQITNVNNSVQVESPVHYMFRKLEAQDKRINASSGTIERLTKRLSAAEEKIERLEKITTPENQSTPKKSLSSLEVN